nr:uncharacterized protein LOC127348067 [Lolium perenne]
MARFFSSVPEVAATETVMSGAAALWSSAARCSPGPSPSPAPPATAEPLPAPPATAAPRDARHGRATRRPPTTAAPRAALARPSRSPTALARCLASPRALRPCLAALAARRPSTARPHRRAPPATPRASPRAPGPRLARTPAAAAAALAERGPRGRAGARMPHLDGRARAAIAWSPPHAARTGRRLAPHPLSAARCRGPGARRARWSLRNEARTAALSGLAVAPLPSLAAAAALSSLGTFMGSSPSLSEEEDTSSGGELGLGTRGRRAAAHRRGVPSAASGVAWRDDLRRGVPSAASGVVTSTTRKKKLE